jgi:hexaprenyl-diphosphate synthase
MLYALKHSKRKVPSLHPLLAYNSRAIPMSVGQRFMHQSFSNKKAATEAKEEFVTPFGKIAQQFNVLRSTIFNSPALSELTKPAEDTLPFTGKATSWSHAVLEAKGLVIDTSNDRIIDPVKLVGRDLWDLKGNIGKLLGTQHPLLNTIAKHYFSADGKHIRPLLVLLMAQATSIAPKRHAVSAEEEHYQIIDTPISSGLKNITSSTTFEKDMHYTPYVNVEGCSILPTQRRLAEISEMIHTASLLHDDVIDESESRRNIPSANASFGNKMAILGGDFLLARSSLALARLRNAECIELMATCIANLVEGEFMQLKNTQSDAETVGPSSSTFGYYLEKTYMKTGSLIAQSCKSSAVLGGCTKEVCNVAFDYGKNLGLAFQVCHFVSLPN